MRAVWFFGGVALGGVLVLMATQPGASEGACCRRVASAARDQIADGLGIPGGVLDFLGITGHLPGLIDKAGL